ncbi:MAG: hypothetical protein K0R50_2113 [Eubacterium sp.]|jgi:hypothetical protein|nr:hypothetical protein [Eubacterium sp.]
MNSIFPVVKAVFFSCEIIPSIDNVQYVFEWSICPAAALKPLARHKALLHAVCLTASQITSLKNHRPRTEIFWQFSRRMDAALLTQGKDDDKEKWQNSRREACYTLSIEGKETRRIHK